MKNNKLTIQINRPVDVVFKFTITPPNSTPWIPGIVVEKTNEFPVKIGTVYSLKNDVGNWSVVTVVAIKENELVEWVSEDENYHCRYRLKKLNNNSTELEYFEWVNKGKIAAPFTDKILSGLKTVLEK